ncbi:MAG: hypothetical protein IKA54_01205 [Clostridia bacterium]|nr:hypothetical protein [Clostridia bacterium]
MAKIQLVSNKGKSTNKGKPKYSASERAAFNMGVGYAAKSVGARIEGFSEKEKQSFKNGVSKVKGKK